MPRSHCEWRLSELANSAGTDVLAEGEQPLVYAELNCLASALPGCC